MLESDQKQRQIVCARLTDVPFRVSDGGTAIGEEDAESVTGYDEDRDVDLAISQRLPEVDEVDDDEVATGGELYLDADADTGAIDGQTFGPVYVAGLLLRPAAGALDAVVDQPPYRSAAVGIAPFLNA